MADQDEQYWSDDEVIDYLKKLRIAIDEGLANAGVEADEVSGFALGGFQVERAVGLAGHAAPARTGFLAHPRWPGRRQRLVRHRLRHQPRRPRGFGVRVTRPSP